MINLVIKLLASKSDTSRNLDPGRIFLAGMILCTTTATSRIIPLHAEKISLEGDRAFYSRWERGYSGPVSSTRVLTHEKRVRDRHKDSIAKTRLTSIGYSLSLVGIQLG